MRVSFAPPVSAVGNCSAGLGSTDIDAGDNPRCSEQNEPSIAPTITSTPQRDPVTIGTRLAAGSPEVSMDLETSVGPDDADDLVPGPLDEEDDGETTKTMTTKRKTDERR